MAEPSIKIIPGGYRFIWPLEQVRITVTRLSDDRRAQSTSAEIAVDSIAPGLEGHLYQARLNLTSVQSKRSLVQALLGRSPESDWATIIESVCVQTLDMHRQGEPVIKVGTDAPSPSLAYRLWPICQEGQPTLLFGEGGTFKSFFALFCGILVQIGRNALGLRPQQGNVLYLDYETSPSEANERVAALCRGLNIEPIAIRYRYCYHPLTEDIEAIVRFMQDQDIGFLIVDSAGPACGGDPSEAELAIRMFTSLRQLHITSLIIAHVAKNAIQRTTTPFGSVFFYNLARSVWEIKRVQNLREAHIRCALYHRKSNNSALRDALGYKVDFDIDSSGHLQKVCISSASVERDALLVQGLPMRERIIACLKDGKATTKELAEMLDTTEGSIRATIARMDSIQRMGEYWGLKVSVPLLMSP